MSMIRLLLKRLAGILKQLLRLENKESLWHGDITICGEANVTRLNHLIPKLSKEILPARSSSVVTRHADLLESSQELYGNKFGSGHGEEI